MVSGAFAVGKPDSDETRMISAAVLANMLLAMSRVPRPRFPNMIQVATIKEPPRGSKLRVSKRDVRTSITRCGLPMDGVLFSLTLHRVQEES